MNTKAKVPDTLKLTTQTYMPSLGTRQNPRNRNSRNRKDSSSQGDRGDEPFKFPQDARREEKDNFAVYVNYIESDKQYVWFAYRSANKETRSKYRKEKGGAVLLWGVFLPHCQNLAPEDRYNCLENLDNRVKEAGEYFTGNEPLKCDISYYGEVRMLGTCLGSFNKYVGLKTAQSYKLVMTYTPDSDPAHIIKEYLAEREIKRQKGNIYIPCNSQFCYRINDNITGWAEEAIICDFIMAFTEFLREDPGAKLQFDWFYDKRLICPPNPEVCEPYLGNVKQLYENSQVRYNENKVPQTKREVYLNHLNPDLRKGKNCRVLEEPNLRREREDNYYNNGTEDLPKYKPEKYQTLSGQEGIEFVKMTPEEFREIGEKVEASIAKEQQAIAKAERKLL